MWHAAAEFCQHRRVGLERPLDKIGAKARVAFAVEIIGRGDGRDGAGKIYFAGSMAPIKLQ